MPTAIPIQIGNHMSLSVRVTSSLWSNRSGFTLRRGERSSLVMLANITDIAETIIIIGEILWCASSMANIIPDMGAPVATENPAHAPPVIEYLSQALCFFAKERIVPRPIAVPIWTDGPSFPSGTPRRKDTRESVKTPMIFRIHLKLIIPRRVAIEVGIPPPLRFGIFLYMLDKRKEIPISKTNAIGRKYR